MRTISAALDLALTLTGRTDHLKVEVDSDGSGTFIELTDYWQKDWVIDCTIDESEDRPVATCKLSVERSFESIHMSPLVTTSPVNATSDLLYVNREIKVYCATTGMGVDTPQSGDWALRFHGYIDDLDMGGNTIKISCRDKGAKVVDQFIKTIVTRPSSGTTPVQTMMQAIVDGDMSPAPTIYVPASPGWNVAAAKVTKQPVMEALKKLADQIGWIVRYRWRAGTGAFELTFYGPDRAVSSTVRDFDPDQYYSIGKASISLRDVRTQVVVYYYLTPGGVIQNYPATSAAPILAKYGDRYMEITEAATSNIDTAGEAQTMADNILADLEEPTLSHSVTMPLFWPAELGDYYGFTDNEVVYDSKQSLALFGVSHKFSKGKATTTMQLRGKPASASGRWMSLEGRPGIAPPVINKTDAVPANLATETNPGTLIVKYDDPRQATVPVRDWATTRCYVDTSSGFTPGSGNLKAEGKTTRFEVGNLIPGETYYAQLAVIDESGNVSTIDETSAQVAAYTGPYHENPENDYTNKTPGATFGVWSLPAVKTTAPPDRWKTQHDAGAGYIDVTALWASGDIYYIASDETGYGAYGCKITQDQSGYPRALTTSELIPVEYKKTYKAELTFYGQSTGGAGPGMDSNVVITYYEDDKVSVAGTDTFAMPTSSVGVGVIFREVNYSDPPIDSAYAEVRIENDSTVAADSAYMEIYSFNFTETKSSFRALENGAATSLVTGSLVPADLDFIHGADWSVANNRLVRYRGEVWQFTAQAYISSIAAGKYFQLAISLNQGSTMAFYGPKIYNHSAGALTLQAVINTGRMLLTHSPTLANNSVSLYCIHDHGSARDVLCLQFSGGVV